MMSILDGTQISSNLWIIFLLWIVASISTCLAVTWWVIVAYTELTVNDNDTSHWLWLHQWFLHLWRVIWFVLLWWLLWLLGQEISYSLWFSGRLNLIAAWIILVLAFQILGIIPHIKVWDNKQKFFQSLWNKYWKRKRITMLFWAATIIIPCWFTQMVQLMALASWSWIMWGCMMWIFALGTLPWLLALWIWTSFAKASHKQYFERLIAVVLIAFSVFSIRWSFWLLWIRDAVTQWRLVPQEVMNLEAMDQKGVARETISFVHDWFSLFPEELFIESWKNYKIVIEPTVDGLWCMTTIALPAISKEIYPVREWIEIIFEIENAQKGDYTFVCSSMWMEQWKIMVR